MHMGGTRLREGPVGSHFFLLLLFESRRFKERHAWRLQETAPLSAVVPQGRWRQNVFHRRGLCGGSRFCPPRTSSVENL